MTSGIAQAFGGAGATAMRRRKRGSPAGGWRDEAVTGVMKGVPQRQPQPGLVPEYWGVFVLNLVDGCIPSDYRDGLAGGGGSQERTRL
jgi:hypothetical protein